MTAAGVARDGERTDEPRAVVTPPDFSRRLGRAELDAITPPALVERVRALLPFVAAHAAEAERLRKPVDAVIEALHAAGVFYHFVPKRYGGLEFGVMDFVDNMLPLGEACASTAWVTSFCMEHNLILSLFPEQAQDEIFGAQPYIIAPGCAMPPGRAHAVEGGFRVTGRWSFATGVMHADWAMGMALDDAERPVGRWFVFPLREAVVYDVWHMEGMAGTGSNDFAVDDLFVPAHRALDVVQMGAGTSPGAHLHPNPLYRMSMPGFLALTSAIPIVGAARGAVNRCREDLETRVSFGAKQSERPAMQVALARADTDVWLAELALRDLVHDVMQLAENDDQRNIAVRARIRARVTAVSSLAREAVRGIVDSMGTSIHRTDNPTQRALRDISDATGHVIQDRSVAMELHGRVMLGMPPQATIY